MSRDKLIDLISKTGPYQAPSPMTPGHDEKHHIAQSEAGSLEQLQPLPEENEDAFGGVPCEGRLTGTSEDVNALSLTGRESSSYLGISSVMAVLRVILWLDPDCQMFVTRDNEPTRQLNREFSRTPSILEPVLSTTPLGKPKPSTWNEPAIINAYFQHIHPATPLVDEQVFRDTYLTAARNDSRWLLLLNTVLAVGAIAASTNAATATHEYYFTLAREQLTVDTLGSAHIETVQALTLLSGYYLHYVQEPNLANAIMGATLRMSTMLGLHRDFSEGFGPTRNEAATQKAACSIEMRRRVWWSIFMLDTWVGSTLGRPSMGRMSQAVTARLPQENIGGSETHLQLMQDSVRFCQISTRMEDSLAISPSMDELERHSLDNAFVEWYQQSSVQSQQLNNAAMQHYNSPRSTTSSTHQHSDGPGITLTKNLMRWRYHLARIILHRPALLWWAMRSHRQTGSKATKAPVLDPSRRAAIELCRTVTSELITDICASWTTSSLPASTFSAWQATWLLYQAVMVPLLSLFSEARDDAIINQSRQLVEISIDALGEMQNWCKGAKRSLEVVRAIYTASRRHSPELTRSAPAVQDNDMLLNDQTDDMLDTMGLDVFGNSSASASISGGVESGGLGTPATLPSSVSSHHHHNLHQQHLQPHSQLQYQHQQQQQQTFTPQQQRPTFIDLPPLSVASPFPPPSHQLPSQPHYSQQTTPHHHPTTTNPFIHPSTTPSASSTSAHSTAAAAAYLESSTTTLLDSLNWSQGWSDTNYPFETPRLGWDPCAIHGWVGGADGMGATGGGGGGGGGYEYFGAELGMRGMGQGEVGRRSSGMVGEED